MAKHTPHPVPYPDVNAIVTEVLVGARTIFGDCFVGMYLFGSLATGDFDPQHSDVDFVVVTASEPAGETISALTAMHARIAAGQSKWATDLEGSYMSRQAFRRHDPADSLHLQICRGADKGGSKLALMEHGSDWVIQRHILRTCGVVVAGPNPADLIDPVHPDEIRHAVRTFAHDLCTTVLRQPDNMRHDGHHAYAIVTLCRILYSLKHGDVVSKPVAARWAKRALGGQWTALIDSALAWETRWSDVQQTLEFMRYTLERSQADASWCWNSGK